MLSDDSIENLIQPIIDRQEKINLYVILKIANTIKKIGEMTPAQLQQIKRLIEFGDDLLLIEREIARLTSLQEIQIEKILDTVAKDSYLDTKKYYEYKKKKFIPYKENKPLQKVVSAIKKQTLGEYKNLSKAQAFMIRDKKNRKILKPTKLSQAYQQTIDTAVQAAQSGVIDYNIAMRDTMKQLVDSGLRKVVYESEKGKVHTQRLDTAVRRNVLDGIRAVNQGVQDETGKQYGADGKEITVHAYPAPDHAPVQGHQFTNEEFDKMQNGENFIDIDGKHFEGFPRSIGVLNCRHFTFSIIIGFTKPNYSKEQLQDILDRNEQGYTLPNGKHFTMYQCTQKQRDYELQIRKAKEGRLAAQKSGDKMLENEYTAKITKLNNSYKAFCKGCGLKARFDKTRITE